MSVNPLVPQGTLNRLIASISWVTYPALNITVSFLGRQAIVLTIDGELTTALPTMTGLVTSPEPYAVATFSAHLVRTQPLVAAYKAQMESSTLLGNCTVRPDVDPSLGGLTPYPLYNCSITGLREMPFAGTEEGWMITFKGYYLLNAALWQAA